MIEFASMTRYGEPFSLQTKQSNPLVFINILWEGVRFYILESPHHMTDLALVINVEQK